MYIIILFMKYNVKKNAKKVELWAAVLRSGLFFQVLFFRGFFFLNTGNDGSIMIRIDNV